MIHRPDCACLHCVCERLAARWNGVYTFGSEDAGKPVILTYLGKQVVDIRLAAQEGA